MFGVMFTSKTKKHFLAWDVEDRWFGCKNNMQVQNNTEHHKFDMSLVPNTVSVSKLLTIKAWG